ncbi:MAG TPA: hypothetical protein VLD18_16885, partial [Verrucomicrobiae bacterium]|nr:hypothetical protein [Verrucomicrobiae bacterium]
MKTPDPSVPRTARDTVEFTRVEQLLREDPAGELTRCFSVKDLANTGTHPERIRNLAAQLAANEACCRLFPNEIARGVMSPADFKIAIADNGPPEVICNGASQAVLNRYRVADISIALTSSETGVSAVA